MMQQNEVSNAKDCLKSRYADANLATEIALEKDRLSFLLNCINFKRPPQSLRVRGLNGLCEENGRLLVQEVESRALQCAIKAKYELIAKLELDLQKHTSRLDVDRGLVALNKKKLNKKLAFFRVCENTKWSEWRKKHVNFLPSDTQGRCVALTKKLKRRIRSRRRKLYKKHKTIVDTARYALENNFVRNISGVEVPLYSIAVLSYGPGWIPPPEANIDQLRIDALNAANKQTWSAVFKDSDRTDEVVPLSLLKNDVTKSAPLFKDPVVNKSRDTIINFASNVSPKPCKQRLNKFEREGLQWLKRAVKTKKIAITQADKGGCILIVNPDLIVSSTLEKLNDSDRYVPLGKSNPLPDLRKELLTY